MVAAAAYRSGSALADRRYGVTHDYRDKPGVEFSEILAPSEAPDWVYDRERLWNEVEAGEKRKDAQLARELEIALPVELTKDEQVALAREFAVRHLVGEGMVADLNIHRDNPENPHLHVLVTLRGISREGFGAKERAWNAKERLLEWRAGWAELANEHLARAGHDIRVDHRALQAQGIDLTPGQKIGVSRERQHEVRLPAYIADRVAASERIAAENGAAIIDDPAVALRALTHQRATFTHHDLARFLHTRTRGADQFNTAFLKVTTAREVVALGRDDLNRVRYTTREMLVTEASLLARASAMATRGGHGVRSQSDESQTLSPEQRQALDHVLSDGDIKAVVGVAGSGKSTLLASARAAWEAQGFTVKGAALSGIAAENLEVASGIRSCTLASFEYQWKAGRHPLTANDVLVIDEAGMIGTRQLDRFLAAADKAGAKVVLVGDPEQLQAIEAGAAFRGVVGEVGMSEITQVRRQRTDWARRATEDLAHGRTC